MHTKIVHFRDKAWNFSKDMPSVKFEDKLSFSIIYSVDTLPKTGGTLINYAVAFKHPKDSFNKKLVKRLLEDRLLEGIGNIPLFIPKVHGSLGYYDYVITILADILATNSFISNRKNFIKTSLVNLIKQSLD